MCNLIQHLSFNYVTTRIYNITIDYREKSTIGVLSNCRDSWVNPEIVYLYEYIRPYLKLFFPNA